MNNTPRIRILPYKSGSASAKALAEALGGKRLRLTGSRFTPREDDLVINWGNSGVTEEAWPKLYDNTHTFLNFSNCVILAANKLDFFNVCKGHDWLPEYWTNPDEIPDECFPIVCRTVLNGHSGDGIVLADSRTDLVDAPLYVRYVRKKDEYRVHIGFRNGTNRDDDSNNNVIAVQRKARKLDVPNDEVNWQIRNAKNGFVFSRNDVDAPSEVLVAAEEAVKALGLDFGAVDVLWNEANQIAKVCEVNTAPGISGTTIEDYEKFFRSFLA